MHTYTQTQFYNFAPIERIQDKQKKKHKKNNNNQQCSSAPHTSRTVFKFQQCFFDHFQVLYVLYVFTWKLCASRRAERIRRKMHQRGATKQRTLFFIYSIRFCKPFIFVGTKNSLWWLSFFFVCSHTATLWHVSHSLLLCIFTFSSSIREEKKGRFSFGRSRMWNQAWNF